MGIMEEDARNPNAIQIRKKTCGVWVLLAIAAVILAAIIAFMVGTNSGECVLENEVGAGAGLGSSNKGNAKEKVTDVRLPGHLIPISYRVKLVPFIIPDNFTIRGYTEINMRCDEDADNVTVHIKNMTIVEDRVEVVETGSGRSVPVSGHAYDEDREFYIARLGGSGVQRGKNYVIKIWFDGFLQDGLRGFYRSKYTNGNGEDVYIATTQFQATDARRAFPCFDEPGLKAKFEVSLGRTRDRSSISNMPIKQGQKGVPMEGTNEYVWDHYEESVPMSTYLVAFVVSDFEFELSPPTGNNVEFRIWARKNALDQIAYAKSIGAGILKFFEDYFNVAYPLPKQDMIAIPDFSAGAMENWGLITYRETAMLYKPGVSSLSNKQRIAIVVSHELAHQWFGNLVTPSWWTDLWLNEGFASYVEYLGVEAVEPKMKLLQQFITSDLQSVMRIDALKTSHPISIPVKHPDEIAEIFDRISYAKGASIIRMMDHFLSTDTFRRGLTNYLKKWQFKAATQDDLWESLTEQAQKENKLPRDVTVKMIMDTWTLQMGFPVINVNRDYNANTAVVTQEHFLSSGAESNEANQKWWVPLTHTTPGGNFENTYSKDWISPNDQSKKLSGMPSRNTAVVFNVQETGYFRVNYDRKNWELLIAQLNSDHTKIHVNNRAQIIDDALNLARAGYLDYDIALGVTRYMSQETEYICWKAALSGFAYIDIMLERTAAYGEFKKYMKKLVHPLYNKIGFEPKADDEHLDTLLRSNVVSWACSLGIEECTENVKNNYRRWMDQSVPDADGSNPINVDLKGTVYCHAVASGDEEEWNFGWERYQKSNVATEKNKLLRGLSCTKQTWLVNHYLNMSLTEGSGIRKQDSRTVIASLASNDIGRDLTFDFVRQKWDKILEYYAGSSFAIAGLVKNVLKNRNTQFDVDEVIQFKEDFDGRLSSGEREARQAIEKGNNNVRWMNNNYQPILDYLTETNEAGRRY